MTEPGLWSSIVKAFYSTDLYRAVARFWRYQGIAYLALLLALCWIPSLIKIDAALRVANRTYVPELLSQVPAMNFLNGELVTEKNAPYEIRLKGQLLAVIDTSGKFTTLEQAGSKILVTKTQAFVQHNPNETRIYDFQKVKKLYLDRSILKRFVDRMYFWIPLVLYPLFYMASLAFRLLQGVLAALVGIVVAGLMKVRLDFTALFNLSLVAMTPAIVLRTVVQVFTRYTFPAWASLVLVLVYLGIAIVSNRTDAAVLEEN